MEVEECESFQITLEEVLIRKYTVYTRMQMTLARAVMSNPSSERSLFFRVYSQSQLNTFETMLNKDLKNKNIWADELGH